MPRSCLASAWWNHLDRGCRSSGAVEPDCQPSKSHNFIHLESADRVVQCLIRILYSGLCHSDLSNSNNIYGLPSPLPAIFGHEGAGLVVALGAGYQGDLAVGDRVGVKYIQDACLGEGKRTR